MVFKNAPYVILLIFVIACGQDDKADSETNTRPTPGESFAEWKARMFSVLKNKESSQERKHHLTRMQAGLKFDQQVIDSYRHQPENYRSFRGYYQAHASQKTKENALRLGHKYENLFQTLERSFFVPPELLLAIWSMETRFGNYMGFKPVIGSLASLSHGLPGRGRGEFFYRQMGYAIQIALDEQKELENFLGSWAGAFGHMQFMPSTFLRHAIDGNDDDIIDHLSIDPTDALSSAASYLQASGWQQGKSWGIEIPVNRKNPAFFQLGRSSLGQASWFSVATFVDANIIGQREIEDYKLSLSDLGALIMPVGQWGNAYLLLENGRAIFAYNRSSHYVLMVGSLLDFFQGKHPLKKTWDDEIPLRFKRDDILRLQKKLLDLGFDPNGLDGIYGKGTAEALRLYQLDRGMIADGFPSQSLISGLDS